MSAHTQHAPRASPRAQAGFTLVEVLVVMIIIAILMAIAQSVFHSARITSGKSSATSVAKAYREAVEQFAVDHEGRLPRAIGSATDWPVAANGPITVAGLARAARPGGGATGRYLRTIPESVTDGTVGVGGGGNFGYITYTVAGTRFEIDVLLRDGTRVCSTGTMHVTIPTACELGI